MSQNQKKTILIIDDEKQIVEALQDLFTDSGYEVVTAHDGTEGLRQLSKIKPHLILLDMNMPRMGGISFYRQIANTPDGKPPYPVLVLTARANLEEFFKELHVDGFMTKPFKFDELLARVQEILEKRYGTALPEPAPQTTPKPAAASRPQTSAPQKASLPKRIMIIGDHENVFAKPVATFSAKGFQIMTAASGTGGIERAVKELPDLILIQIELPDFTGDVVALKLKMLPKTTDIPVILYSVSPEHEVNYTAAGRIYEKLEIKVILGADHSEELVSQSYSLLEKR